MEGAQKVRDGSHSQSGISCSPNGCDSSEEQTREAETAIDLDGWNMLRLGLGSEAEKQYKRFRHSTACQHQQKDSMDTNTCPSYPSMVHPAVKFLLGRL